MRKLIIAVIVLVFLFLAKLVSTIKYQTDIINKSRENIMTNSDQLKTIKIDSMDIISEVKHM